jgi:hypothetical protein
MNRWKDNIVKVSEGSEDVDLTQLAQNKYNGWTFLTRRWSFGVPNE